MRRFLIVLVAAALFALSAFAATAAAGWTWDKQAPSSVCGTCEGGSRPCADWQAGWLNVATHEHCELTFRGPTWYEWVYRPDLS